MISGETYIFTVRDRIKSIPRIVQERVYVTPFEYRMISVFDFLFAAEKDKKYKTEMYKISHGKEKHEVFSDNSVYYKCFNKFVESKEGWYNLKKKV